MKRSTPLARGVVRLARRPLKRSRTERDPSLVDARFTSFVHQQPCCVSLCLRKNIEQHHKREGAGIALRGHDRDSISLCREHHAALHGFTGPFKGWNRERLRAFVNDHIARLNALYDEGAA